MALKATVFKVELDIADMDRQYYQNHALTLAQHPSETDERMMVRVIAFALHADEALGFTRGLCADDEPELWKKDLTGEIDTWIDVGLPEPRRLRKAGHRARRVYLYAFGGRAVDVWWARHRTELAGIDNLVVRVLDPEATTALAATVERGMRISCTLEDGQLWFSDASGTVAVGITTLHGAG